MSSSDIVEEQFVISKSSMVTYQVVSMAFEYILAQNENKNPKGYEFLMKIQQLAKETVITFGLPTDENDLDQMYDDFTKKVVDAIEKGILPK